ncbi:MAG: prepilin-type N-terminal cleavage/methylation domain-containing protein [Patescibacteria group bacterium]
MKNFFAKNKKNSGFTIIELMVAISLFTILIIIGIGALLNANSVHKKNQKIRSLMDSLSFIMEDMSTNIRTGTEYNGNISDTDLYTLTFKNHNDVSNPTWLYAFVEESDPDHHVNLYKSTTGTITDATLLNSSEIVFDYGSGFDVIGSEEESVAKDGQQPYVIIRLSGFIKYKEDVIPFSLESSVSQRLVDVDSN